MGQINYARIHGTRTYTHGEGTIDDTSGTVEAIFDENIDTGYVQHYQSSKYNEFKNFSGTVTITFPSAVYINTVSSNTNIDIEDADSGKSTYTTKLSYVNSAGVTTVLVDNSTNDRQILTRTLNTFVRSVSIYLKGRAVRGATDGDLDIYLRWYHLEAVGLYTPPSGIKIKDDTRTYALADDPDSLSPVFYRNTSSATRRLLLVDTTSPLATPFRIQTSSGAKAFAASYLQ